MTSDHLTPAQKAVSGFWPGYFDTMGWGFGMSVRTRRTHLGPSAGSYGGSGFYGTAWYNDPAEHLTTIFIMQRAHASAVSPMASSMREIPARTLDSAAMSPSSRQRSTARNAVSTASGYSSRSWRQRDRTDNVRAKVCRSPHDRASASARLAKASAGPCSERSTRASASEIIRNAGDPIAGSATVKDCSAGISHHQPIRTERATNPSPVLSVVDRQT